MKKLITSLFVLVLLVLSVGCSSNTPKEETAWERIQREGVIVCGTEGTYPPMSYHDENNELTGFDVEVARAVAEKLGVDIRFEESDWDSLLIGLGQGSFDIMCNEVTPTDERREAYDFSDPYTYIYNVVIVPVDNTDITSFEDLKGKKVSNTISSTHAQIAESYGAEIVAVDTFEASIQLVLQGRADATINNELVFNDYITQTSDANLKIAAYSPDAETTAIPVKKGETDLVNALNQAIAELQADGTLKALSEKYFGKDISESQK